MAKLESHNGYYLWHYLPSIPAAVIFGLLFLVITVLHFWRMIKTRTWFCLAFSIGGVFEIIGYFARITAHNKTAELVPYIIQSTFLLVAPALFAASIYMTLGRLICAVEGQKLSLVRVDWLTKTFVAGDVFSFLIQSGGAGFMASSDKSKTGQNIIIAGLIIQVIMFGVFGLTALLFHINIRRQPTRASYDPELPWARTLWMLYGASAAIFIRSIFRVIEYVVGNDGYLLSNEWTLYIFDAVLMFLTMVGFWIWYPSRVRPRKDPSIEIGI